MSDPSGGTHVIEAIRGKAVTAVIISAVVGFPYLGYRYLGPIGVIVGLVAVPVAGIGAYLVGVAWCEHKQGHPGGCT